MQHKIKSVPVEKNDLHPRNLHRGRYDFKALVKSCGELGPFVRPNPYGDESVDFANPAAVKVLNKALLKHFYHVDDWDIPDHYLCPPIPGRADYIHYIADLLGDSNGGTIPTGNGIHVLDIGMGANCIYPILGHMAYGWHFVGSEIDTIAIGSAREIISKNNPLKDAIECRLQLSSKCIFKNIIRKDEYFDLAICNPPFHSSAEEALSGTERKWKNLGIKREPETKLNFGGQNKELWCEGGESAFISRMIAESPKYSKQCKWFSTLVSKKDRLPAVYNALKKVKAADVRTIEMAQGQKTSRIIAWTF